MTRTLLVRNKQPQHSLPGIAHKQASSAKKIRCKCATFAPYLLCPRLGSRPQPGSEKKKIRRKRATFAPYLLCPAWRAVPGKGAKRKKYGANAPHLRRIRCSIDFCVMLCNEQAKKKKIWRKRATFAPYSRRNSPGNRLSTHRARAIMKKLEL